MSNAKRLSHGRGRRGEDVMERCGQSYGLHQVAHDTLSRVGFGLDYWWSRMNPAFPHLCAQLPDSSWVESASAVRCWSYDRSFDAQACDGTRAFIEAYSNEDGLDQYDWHAERCQELCE